MIKEALQYIASLKEDAMGIVTEEINGETYIKGQGVRRIENDHCECMTLNTLDALTIMIVEAIKGDMLNLPLMVRVTGNTVDVFSAMDRFMKRDHIAQSRPDVPTIRFNRYMPVEEFIIQLQTCFEEDENHNKTKLLAFVSKLSSEVKVEIEDDGISQKVTSSTGAAVKHSESITLPPIVRLKPMNTYPEIDQVETMYLLRVNKDGDVALFEADGGRWRFEEGSEPIQTTEDHGARRNDHRPAAPGPLRPYSEKQQRPGDPVYRRLRLHPGRPAGGRGCQRIQDRRV